MKTLLTVIMTFSFNIYAYEVPADAVIKVYTKDGKEIGNMSRKQYKVVKIEDKPQPKSEPTSVVVQKKKEESKYQMALTLGGGVGPDGLGVQATNNGTTVEERMRPIGTAGLCAMKNNGGVCGTMSTNSALGLQFIIPLGNNK